MKRALPVIRKIREKLGNTFLISIDSYKSAVAKEALNAGADIVNSLGGFRFDKNLAKVVSEHGCPIIIYHIKGKPKTMQKKTMYKNIIVDVKSFFQKQIEFGIKNGMKREQFFIDPGIGFGKNVEQNLEIIKRLYEFKSLKLPIVIGVSRKSHLGVILQEEMRLLSMPYPTERLEASLAETAIAVMNGASIVRTHDVFTTHKFLSVLDRLKN